MVMQNFTLKELNKYFQNYDLNKKIKDYDITLIKTIYNDFINNNDYFDFNNINKDFGSFYNRYKNDILEFLKELINESLGF